MGATPQTPTGVLPMDRAREFPSPDSCLSTYGKFLSTPLIGHDRRIDLQQILWKVLPVMERWDIASLSQWKYYFARRTLKEQHNK